MTRTTLLLAWSVGPLAVGTLGYATSDAEGAAIAVVALLGAALVALRRA